MASPNLFLTVLLNLTKEAHKDDICFDALLNDDFFIFK